MSERPTLRTDSAIMEIPSKFGSICVVRVELALDLERELGDALQERDELREEVASLRLEAKYYDEADALRKCRERERDEAREERDIARLSAQDADKAHDRMVGELEKVYKERDEAREAFIEARKHREQLNSLLASYTACWDEIKTALGGPEEGDQTCDLDRVLKAIRERDDYKWQLHIAKGEIAEARKMERAWKKEETK